jgi:hypothetical protein
MPATQTWWFVLLVASVPAVAALVAAIVAARAAKSSKASEHQAQRMRDLENRISERKYNTYKPVIDTLRDLFDKDKSARLSTDPRASKEFQDKIADFAIWVAIYGSDESVSAFHNLMQASYHAAPPHVLVRFYADFVLAARRDIGYPDTDVTAADVLGTRITDLYQNADFLAIATQPIEETCRRVGWTPPWSVVGEKKLGALATHRAVSSVWTWACRGPSRSRCRRAGYRMLLATS